MKRGTFLRMILAAAALGVACDGKSETSPDGADPVDALAARLNAAGLAVVRAGRVDQPFFSVRGEILAAGSSQIQVFVFASAAAASAVAATVSADGGSIATTQVMWVAPPHFYRSGELIVLYVGSEANVLTALVRVLGPQFAGR